MDVSILIGKTLTEVTRCGSEITFKTEDGKSYMMHHQQDCCESVYLEDLCGDLEDLVGTPILRSEEVDNKFKYTDYSVQEWTFYKISTIKGDVTLCWHGESNGYYSIAVNFDELE